MKKTYSLINLIKAYYLDSNIPMYLFSDEKCIFCMPEQNELTYPPFQYLQELFRFRSYHSLYDRIWNHVLFS